MVGGEGDVDGFARERNDGESVGADGTFGDEAVRDDDVDIPSQAREFVFGEVDVVHAQVDPRVLLAQPSQGVREEIGERARQSGQGDLSDGLAEVALRLRLHAGERAGPRPARRGRADVPRR